MSIRELHLEITRRCLLRCPKCPRTYTSGQYKISDMSTEHFEELVTVLKPKTLNFCGNLGDPIFHKKLDKFILLGNSLGGHVGLYYTKLFKKRAAALVLTGSSGLYESAMGSGYTRRGDYEVMKKKVEEVFYDPKVATKELVDEVFETVNNRHKLVKTLAIAKSAIRHNMGKDLPKMTLPVCLIWGEDDIVTPPNVADEFHELLPNSDLFWLKKCGHAAMMEHPEKFNEIVIQWLSDKNIA